MDDEKLVVVSRSFPPFIVGGSILLRNLLSAYPGKVEAIAAWQYGTKADPGFEPPCPTRYVRMPFGLAQRAFDRFLPYLVVHLTARIRKELRKSRPSAVLASCPSGEFFIAAFRACQSLGIPFFAHMHDLWEENLVAGTKRKANAEQWERRILTGAEKVYCMTELQRRYYEEKYGIAPELLEHPVPSDAVPRGLPQRDGPTREEKTIVFTGNISRHMNLDAMRQFIKAVDGLPRWCRVKMFVNWDRETLERWDLYHDRVEYRWLPKDEVNEEIRNADLLFLPLSHKDCSVEEVRTVFATKTLDYLISGVPILVFAPEDSFHATSARSGEWGYVVSEDDPVRLREGIVQALGDESLRARLVEGALGEAKRRNAADQAARLAAAVREAGQSRVGHEKIGACKQPREPRKAESWV